MRRLSLLAAVVALACSSPTSERGMMGSHPAPTAPSHQYIEGIHVEHDAMPRPVNPPPAPSAPRLSFEERRLGISGATIVAVVDAATGREWLCLVTRGGIACVEITARPGSPSVPEPLAEPGRK